MADYSTLLRDRVTLAVRSVDRIFLQGYVPRLQNFATENAIPVIHFAKGDNREEIAPTWRRRLPLRAARARWR